MAVHVCTSTSENRKRSRSISPRYRISANACFSTDHDGTAVLNVVSGKFHSLIGVGSLMWSKIAAHPEGVTVAMLVDEFLAKQDGVASETTDKVEPSLACMLDTLTKIGLIESGFSPSHRITGSRIWSSVIFATLGRQVAGLLIRLRRPRAAAFIEFAIFYVLRRIGHFSARHEIIRRWPINPRQELLVEEIPQLCAAVDEAATWYPKESLCLQKASVKTCLLRQYGVPAEMKIGVHKQPFQAHAWVEVAGDVVGDYKGVQKYFNVIACW